MIKLEQTTFSFFFNCDLNSRVLICAYRAVPAWSPSPPERRRNTVSLQSAKESPLPPSTEGWTEFLDRINSFRLEAVSTYVVCSEEASEAAGFFLGVSGGTTKAVGSVWRLMVPIVPAVEALGTTPSSLFCAALDREFHFPLLDSCYIILSVYPTQTTWDSHDENGPKSPAVPPIAHTTTVRWGVLIKSGTTGAIFMIQPSIWDTRQNLLYWEVLCFPLLQPWSWFRRRSYFVEAFVKEGLINI